jgi:transposase
MAMSVVETCPITGGVDTDLDVHVAAALDANGGLLGVESFATTRAGFGELSAWLCRFGSLQRVGVEGTGAYGAGLARFLRSVGVAVVEVDRPSRQARRRHGKSDSIDAIEAARATLSGHARTMAKTADGDVEAICVLLIAYRSGRDARIKCLNQLRHLGFTAADELRERFRAVTVTSLARDAAALRPNPNGDGVAYATKRAMHTLARRVLDVDADCAVRC